MSPPANLYFQLEFEGFSFFFLNELNLKVNFTLFLFLCFLIRGLLTHFPSKFNRIEPL